MKTVNLMLIFCGLFFLAACDNNPNRQDATNVAEERNEERFDDRDDLKDDSEFVVDAASSSMMEIELGRLAVERANNAQVKQFAQKMIDDHGQANEKLKQLAQQKNIALPSGLSDEQRRHIDDLREKTGREFDKEYMNHMVDEHQDDVKKFEDATNDLNDAQIRSWANETLPVLRQHKEEAERINDALEERS